MRFAAVVLTLAMTGAALGCTGKGGNSTSDQTGELTVPVPSEILTEDLLSKYVIVRPDYASETLANGFGVFYSAFKAAVPGIKIKDDFLLEGDDRFTMTDYEILLAGTNREESVSFMSNMRQKDYGYALIGTKLVIAGGSDEASIMAFEKFKSDVLDGFSEGNRVFFSSAMNYMSEGVYGIDELTIGGIPVGQFTLVYPRGNQSSEKRIAEIVADTILDVCGISINIVSDIEDAAASGHRIFVGRTRTDKAAEVQLAGTEGYIGFDGNDVRIYGANATSIRESALHFVQPLSNTKQEKYDYALSAEDKFNYENNVLTAMSYNILVSNNTTERQRRVLEMVAKYMPDTVGMQEASPKWMNVLGPKLDRFGYKYVGEGRDGGTDGEHNPIFYNSYKFKLLDSGTKWLSQTPDRVSKYSQSSLNRIYTYALLERLSDGLQIMVVNTHLDHTSSAARELQVQVLMKFISEHLDKPLVLTGDFNTSPGSSCYKYVISGGMTDSSNIALEAKIEYTHDSNSIIDFAFVNAKKILVNSYKVCNEKILGDYTSDHFPVLIEYTPLG